MPSEPGFEQPPSNLPFARARGGSSDDEGHLVLERLLFFSDAVFAIAMTLLVVDLRPPDGGLGSDAAAAQALGDALGRILAFVISFIVVGLYWDAHLRIFRVVGRADRTLIGLNLAFLIWIAFMPYPTSILGGGGLTLVSIAFYAVVQIGAGLSEAAVWVYATRHPAVLRSPIEPGLARLVTGQILRGPVVFAISLLVALVSPALAAVSWVLLIPASWIIDRRLGQAG